MTDQAVVLDMKKTFTRGEEVSVKIGRETDLTGKQGRVFRAVVMASKKRAHPRGDGYLCQAIGMAALLDCVYTNGTMQCMKLRRTDNKSTLVQIIEDLRY